MKDRGYIIALGNNLPPKDGGYYIVSYEVGIRYTQGQKICHCVIWRNGRVVHDPKRPRIKLVRAIGYRRLIKVEGNNHENRIAS